MCEKLHLYQQGDMKKGSMEWFDHAILIQTQATALSARGCAKYWWHIWPETLLLSVNGLSVMSVHRS